jgi:hypothetical protein
MVRFSFQDLHCPFPGFEIEEVVVRADISIF